MVSTLQSLDGNADFYEALSSFSRLANLVKVKAHTFSVVYFFRQTNRILDSMFEKVQTAMEGKTAPDPTAGPVTEIKLRQSVDDLMRLHNMIQYVYEMSRRAGLANNRLTANGLLKMRANSERILDLVDWLELMMQTAEVQAIFERGRHEEQAGEVSLLEQVM